jgi:hypothetical protein
VLLVLFAGIFGGFLFGKRRRREEATMPKEERYKWPEFGRNRTSIKHETIKHEMEDTGIREMGDTYIAEMADTRRHDMEGEGHLSPYAYQHNVVRGGPPPSQY